MTADRWMKLQRNVTMGSGLMMGSFWLIYSMPDLWWFGLLMLAYSAQNLRENMRIDTADERAELIAARAGFLSQKLMLGVGIVLFALDHRRRFVGSGSLIGVLLVGTLSEALFRRMLGAEERKSPWTFIAALTVGSILLLAGLLVWFWWMDR